MKHYFFEETFSGKKFLVGADNEEDATLTADCVVEEIGYIWNNYEWGLKRYGEVTKEEAEDSGLDEY